MLALSFAAAQLQNVYDLQQHNLESDNSALMSLSRTFLLKPDNFVTLSLCVQSVNFETLSDTGFLTDLRSLHLKFYNFLLCQPSQHNSPWEHNSQL